MPNWDHPRQQSVVAWVAALWLLGFASADAAYGHRLVLIGFFSAAPLIASGGLNARHTALYAGAAIGCAMLAGWWDDIRGDPNYNARILSVSVISLLSVIVAALRERREDRLRRMTAIADAAQRAVLPHVPQRIGDLRFASRYRSATREALIGGDLYEVVRSRNRVRVILGDVRGKGLEAVQLAALILLGFRRAAATAGTLAEVAAELDLVARPALTDEDFVTALLVELEGDRLTMVNCGHEPPLLVSGQRAELLRSGHPMMPIGLESEFVAVRTSWPPGARLLLYTDGLSESRDLGRRFLRMGRVAAAIARGDAEQALDAVMAEVRRHTRGRADDDMALLLIARDGPEQNFSARPEPAEERLEPEGETSREPEESVSAPR